MNLEKFRRQLRQEADRWVAEALIDRSQYERLAERYSFNTLDTNTNRNFAIILIGLGVILLGLGAITFVAANWQGMSRELRSGLLFVALIGSNWLGFSLWQYTQHWQRLGQGLLLLGAFVMGANIALLGQIFHVTGSLYGLLFMWGFGVLAMAYSLRFKPLGIMAIILIGLGYWYHFYDAWSTRAADSQALLIAENMLVITAVLFVPLAYWCRSRTIGILSIAIAALAYSSHLAHPALAEKSFIVWLLVEYMPIAAALLFIPLAYRLRSHAVFLFSVLLVLAGLISSITYLTDFALPWYLSVAISAFLIPALAWSYDDALFSQWLGNSANSLTFKPLSRGLGVALLVITCYAWSFYGVWSWGGKTSFSLPALAFERWPSLVNVCLFAGLMVIGYLQLLRQPRQLSQGDREAKSSQIVFVVLCAIAALPMAWHGALNRIPEIATFTYNVLLFLLAAGLIRESLEQSRRLPFWAGIFLLTLQIISRLFEYDTGLLIKAFTFALCGIAVIVAGLWFERYLRLSHPAISNTHLPSTIEEQL